MINTTSQPTNEAIETAIRNGYRDMNNYTVTMCVPGMFTVQHVTDTRRVYTVDTTEGFENCQCEAFARESVCKHCFIVAETNHIEAEEAKLSDIDYIAYTAG